MHVYTHVTVFFQTYHYLQFPLCRTSPTPNPTAIVTVTTLLNFCFIKLQIANATSIILIPPPSAVSDRRYGQASPIYDMTSDDKRAQTLDCKQRGTKIHPASARQRRQQQQHRLQSTIRSSVSDLRYGQASPFDTVKRLRSTIRSSVSI